MQLLSLFADATAATTSLQNSLSPIVSTIITVAGAAFALFLVIGGIYYITSSGNQQRLQHAKDILLKGTIGFVIVIAASSITLTMQSAYSQKPAQPQGNSGVDFGEQRTENQPVGNQLISDFIKAAVNDVGKPVTETISNFLTSTPLMAQTPKVFNLWLIVLAICNVLFVLVVALVGFRIMSGTLLGFEEGEIRQLLPQIVATFLAMNLSIFFIDFLITISNAMSKALMLGTDNQVFVTALGTLIAGVSTLPIGGMILILILVIVAVMLAIYYLMRIVTLYVGAAVSPLIALLWLIPSFKDFAVMAARQYVVTIFILFVHMIILILATSLIDGVGESNAFISALLGITTLLVLIKTNSVVNSTMSTAGVARSAKRLGSSFASSSRNFANTVKDRATSQQGSGGSSMKPAAATSVAGGTSASTSMGANSAGRFQNTGGSGGQMTVGVAKKNSGKPAKVNVTRVPESAKNVINSDKSNKFVQDSKARKAGK